VTDNEAPQPALTPDEQLDALMQRATASVLRTLDEQTDVPARLAELYRQAGIVAPGETS
jgi:hypothetical protein